MRSVHRLVTGCDEKCAQCSKGYVMRSVHSLVKVM